MMICAKMGVIKLAEVLFSAGDFSCVPDKLFYSFCFNLNLYTLIIVNPKTLKWHDCLLPAQKLYTLTLLDNFEQGQ